MGFNRCGVSDRMGWHIASGPEIGYWVDKQLGVGYHAERSNAIGLVREGEIVAGVVYQNWNGRSLVTHIAATGRLTKFYLWAIYDYAFNVCGVDKIIAPVSSENEKSIRMVSRMGFAEEARIKDAQPEGDIILFTMKKSDCRFLGDRYGKENASTASSA
jgi:hypothetical protein